MPLVSLFCKLSSKLKCHEKVYKICNSYVELTVNQERLCWWVTFGLQSLRYGTQFVCGGQRRSVSGLYLLLTALKIYVAHK